VEKCRLSGFDSGLVFKELTSSTSWIGDTSIVASQPFRICECIENYQSICIQRGVCTDNVHIRKHPGETFFVPVVAMGQKCGTVPTYIRSYFDAASSGRFVDFQNIQPVGKTCTNLTYTIFSTNAKETVKLYADGQCSTAGYPLILFVLLLPCPHGFMLSKSGTCVCEQRLQKYTNSCNITDRTIAHDGDYWMGYDKQREELILHPHCPFDYCMSIGKVDLQSLAHTSNVPTTEQDPCVVLAMQVSVLYLALPNVCGAPTIILPYCFRLLYLDCF